MLRHITIVSIVSLALALGSCTEQRDTYSDNIARINGGTVEAGEPGVVFIYHAFSGSACSGTLISPHVVVTAKHCVQNSAGGMLAFSGYQIGIGPNAWSIDHSYGVVDVRTTGGIAISEIDVAVIILNQAAQETPYDWAFEIDGATFVGRDVLLVGYGQDRCPSGNAGRKLRTVDRVTGWVGTNTFVSEGLGANSGDSGGPVFDPDTKQLLGVMSSVPDPDQAGCTGATYSMRIDAFRDMINQALGDAGDCVKTAARDACNNGVDDDCNGIVDDGCAANGAPCSESSECASRFCHDVGTGAICTEQCDPVLDHIAQCGTGAYCRREGCGVGVCAPGVSGSGKAGETCGSDADCASLLCVRHATAGNICAYPCNIDAGGCLASEVCAPDSAGATCGGCVPADLGVTSLGLGEICEGDTDCVSSTCINDGGQLYCTQACSDQTPCPSAFHCRGGQCVRGHLGRVGEPCVSNDDCEESLGCVPNPTGNYCSASCAAGETCPPGTSCGNGSCLLGGLPLGATCTAAAECYSQGCFAFGGQQTCTAVCDRDQPCPPLSACVISDQGIALCQPSRFPIDTEVPTAKPAPKKGCQTSGSSEGTTVTLILLLFLVLRRRRRT